MTDTHEHEGPTPEQLQAFLEGVEQTILEHGTSVQHVFGTEESSAFAYTAGMTDLGMPELCIAGLPPESTGVILNNIRDRAKAGEFILQPGAKLTDVVQDYDVVLAAVDEDHECNVARRLYGDNVRVLQVVMPDMAGRFPWEDGYDLDRRIQKTWWVKPE